MDEKKGKTPQRPGRFLFQMRDDLRHAIEKSAQENGRNLTAEINHRLRESLKKDEARPGLGEAIRGPLVAQNETGDYKVPVEVSATDRAMLQVFRALTPEKQLALLSLFK